MPLYRFKAYTTAGEMRDGEIEALDAEAAKGLIYDQGLLPIDAVLATASDDAPWWQREIFAQKKMPDSELVRFTRELATLLSADLSIDDALRLVSAQGRGRVSVRFSERLLERVLAGKSLSDALDDDPLELPPSYVPMIRAGEASGALAAVFGELATLLERASEVRANIRSALVYPSILLAVAMLAVTLIMSVLLPNLAPIFENAGAPPPIAISTMLAVKAFVSDHWIACLVAVGFVAFGAVLAFTSSAGSSLRDRLKLRLPMIGTIVRDLETARFARVLGTLMKNGVPLLGGLEITSRVAKNKIFNAGIVNAVDHIREGQSLSEALAGPNLIAPLGQRLVAVGEQSGRLDTMLLHLAVVLEKDLKVRIDRMMSLLTPALTILIGLGVGGLILSVMNAILSVNDVAFQ